MLLWQQQKCMEVFSTSRSERDAQLAKFGSQLDASNHAVPWFPATNHLSVHDAVGAVSGYKSLPDMKVRRDVLGALADWAARVLRWRTVGTHSHVRDRGSHTLRCCLCTSAHRQQVIAGPAVERERLP